MKQVANGIGTLLSGTVLVFLDGERNCFEQSRLLEYLRGVVETSERTPHRAAQKGPSAGALELRRCLRHASRRKWDGENEI